MSTHNICLHEEIGKISLFFDRKKKCLAWSYRELVFRGNFLCFNTKFICNMHHWGINDFKWNGYTSRGGNSVKLFLPPFWKGVYFNRKEFAPHGSKFFPFRVDPFSDRTWLAEKQTGSHKSCLLCKTEAEIYHVYQIPRKMKRSCQKIAKLACIKRQTQDIYSLTFNWVSFNLTSTDVGSTVHLTLVLLNPDKPCLCKQCRSISWFLKKPNDLNLHCLSFSMWLKMYQQSGSSNVIGWNLERGVAS